MYILTYDLVQKSKKHIFLIKIHVVWSDFLSNCLFFTPFLFTPKKKRKEEKENALGKEVLKMFFFYFSIRFSPTKYIVIRILHDV